MKASKKTDVNRSLILWDESPRVNLRTLMWCLAVGVLYLVTIVYVLVHTPAFNNPKTHVHVTSCGDSLVTYMYDDGGQLVRTAHTKRIPASELMDAVKRQQAIASKTNRSPKSGGAWQLAR